MKVLLNAWRPDEAVDGFCDRVVRDGIIDKATARRARDVARRVFANRFLLPEDYPARHMKQLLESGAASGLISDLAMLFTARSDLLVRDVITDVYWPSVREGRLYLSVDDVVVFIQGAAASGRVEEAWSSEVSKKVARGLVKALVEFGLLEDAVKGRREIAPYRPSTQLPIYLAYLLHLQGLSDQAVLEHSDWRLFGYDRERLLAQLASGEYADWWMLQVGGSVVRMNWMYASIEEVLDALAR
jgi:hypothetical protein